MVQDENVEVADPSLPNAEDPAAILQGRERSLGAIRENYVSAVTLQTGPGRHRAHGHGEGIGRVIAFVEGIDGSFSAG